MDLKRVTLETEIYSILDDCVEQKLSQREMIEVFSSLGLPEDLLSGQTGKDSRRGSLLNRRRNERSVKEKIITCLCLFAICIAAVEYWDGGRATNSLKFHGLAIFRIILIKILPLWNWTDLYYRPCLVKNPYYEVPMLNVDDCTLCETIDEIHRLSNVSQSEVLENYIRKEKPFIVTDAMEDWHVMNTDQFWFDNITELFLHKVDARVCNINTNLRLSDGNLDRILKKLYSPHTNEWFLHWENCQKEGAKLARQFYRRPYFMSNSVDLTGPNWILMSSNYKGRVFKKVDPKHKLLMLYQIRGRNHVRIIPRETCRSYCPEMVEVVEEGEILTVMNLLWQFEYIPEEGDNLAIVSDVSWPSLE